ncbi:MAG: crossover junction endodeoxyribonuclease RuvC [Thermoanaerobaculia bacterium]
MRVLGIDPGSVTTGYGVVDEIRGNLTLVTQGSIRAGKAKDLPDRLVLIFEGLREVIAAHAPAAAAIESPFAGRNVRSLVQLSQARGVAVLAARVAGLEIFEYAPSAVKNAIVGYGRAEKHQVAKMVKMLLPGMREVTLGADAADALAVAICHVHISKFTSRIRKQ